MPYEWAPGLIDRLPEGIEPYEVLQVLGARRRRPVPALTPRGARVLLLYGRTRAGRLLVVVLRLRAAFESTIVGAREATGKEIAEHVRWEKAPDD